MCSSSTALIIAFLSASSALGGHIVPNPLASVWTAIDDEFDIEHDEARALDAKSEEFWQPVLKAAEEVKQNQHAALYQDAEAVMAELPAENSYVREALQEAVTQLHHADDTLAEQALESSELATEKLADPAGGWEDSLSFLSGSQKLFSLAMVAIRHLLGLSYKDRLHEQVQQRQADILPSLRGSVRATANVLAETREASKKGYDILKYDIYNEGAPKTPEAAKKVAQQIVHAADEARHKFLAPIVASVDGITQDVRGEEELPSATVNHAVASGLGVLGEEVHHLRHRSTLEV